MPIICEPTPICNEELKWWVSYAMTLPTYHEAQDIENALRYRLAGLASPSEKELLNSIRTFYHEIFYDKLYTEVRNDLESRLAKSYNCPILNVTDDQIAESVIRVQEKFSCGRDYYGIYRILVDTCGWPSVITDFCQRFSSLVFPGTLIYNVAYDSKKPSGSPLYQAIQSGSKKEWPIKYEKWEGYETNDKNFIQRKKIAVEFLKILEEF